MLDQVGHGNDAERLGKMFDRAPGFMALVEGSDLRFTVANKAFQDLVGRSDLLGRPLAEALPELDDQGIDEILTGVGCSGEAFVARAMPLTVIRSDLTPQEVVLDLVFQPMPQSSGIFIQGHDVTDDKRSEMLRIAHAKVLELAIGDSPLEQTLSELDPDRRIHVVAPGFSGRSCCSTIDGKHLRHGAAPSLPEAYCEAIDGAEIGAVRRILRHRGLPRRARLCLRHRERSLCGRISRNSRCRTGFAPAGRRRS